MRRLVGQTMGKDQALAGNAAHLSASSRRLASVTAKRRWLVSHSTLRGTTRRMAIQASKVARSIFSILLKPAKTVPDSGSPHSARLGTAGAIACGLAQ